MNRTLLWDAAPGEIRVGLVEHGKLVEFRICRPNWHAAVPGAHFTARVIGRGNNGKLLADIGGGVEAQLEQGATLPQGALLAVELVRMPLPEPGRWKLAIVRAAPDKQAEAATGLIEGKNAVLQFLLAMTAMVGCIRCRDARVARDLADLLKGSGPPIVIDPAAIEDGEFDLLADQAVRGEFPVVGGMVSIERTRAMTVIDVDGGGDPLALNVAAARETARLLRLLDIGGQVGIDFLALPDRSARQMVDGVLAEACDALGGHERTAINGFGFAQIVRPRPRPSIPEILCGTTPGRMSLESRATALLRHALRSVGVGTRQIVAPPAVIDLLRAWPAALDEAAATLGAPMELVPDSGATGYGHVHVRP